MITEEEVKAYDEAIERAKNYEREYRSVLKRLMITIDRFRAKKYICIDLDELESYFPEIKGIRSDEMKEKIKNVIRVSSASDGERICMIDWVETHSKQGEQKPTSDIRYEVNAEGSLSVVNGKPFDYEKATITQKDFAPKQEWSEEDENMVNDLIEGCISSKKAYHLAHTSEEIADWLKSIKDRVKEKKE